MPQAARNPATAMPRTKGLTLSRPHFGAVQRMVAASESAVNRKNSHGINELQVQAGRVAEQDCLRYQSFAG